MPRKTTSGMFNDFVRNAQLNGNLVVQPRLGVGKPADMRSALIDIKHSEATVAGTITLDSYTRTNDHDEASRALTEGVRLNGYPIVAHGPVTTREVLAGVQDSSFSVQVRHGSAEPQDIFCALIQSGISATEGGPVSYCLPYGRIPLTESVRNWASCCEQFARLREAGGDPHLETFGGCLLGQLCPPSLLIAVAVLEALFFQQHGITSVSLSYAQQTNLQQDSEAVAVLHQLANEMLHGDEWHLVIYAYMGLYPRSPEGSLRLLDEATALAALSPAARLIVKTASEAHRIPTVAENVEALERAAAVASRTRGEFVHSDPKTLQVYAEARALIETVLELEEDVGKALTLAFRQGYLDVPYCVHPDNRCATSSYIDDKGWLRWAETGRMPLGRSTQDPRAQQLTSTGLLEALSYVRHKFDNSELASVASESTAVNAY